MPDYAALADKKQELIRKGLEGSVFTAAPSVAGITAATLFTASTGTLKTLPTGYKDLGWTTAAGGTFSRSISENTINSWGSTSPTRTDITGDTTTLSVVAQETKLDTIALYTGVDPATLVPAAATGGSVEIRKPLLPNPRYYRVLVLAVDQSSDGEIYLARYLPNAKVTNFGNQVFTNGADAMGYDVTFTAYEDSAAGFTESWLYGGPGWAALLTDMGFPTPA